MSILCNPISLPAYIALLLMTVSFFDDFCSVNNDLSRLYIQLVSCNNRFIESNLTIFTPFSSNLKAIEYIKNDTTCIKNTQCYNDCVFKKHFYIVSVINTHHKIYS